MENVMDEERKSLLSKAWDLDKLRQKESIKYPDLSISSWHIGDLYSLTYMNEKRNALVVNLTSDLQYKESFFKEDRYVAGDGQKADLARLPDDLKAVYQELRQGTMSRIEQKQPERPQSTMNRPMENRPVEKPVNRPISQGIRGENMVKSAESYFGKLAGNSDKKVSLKVDKDETERE